MNRLVLVPILFMVIIGCETIGQTTNSSNGTTLKVYNNKKIIMKTIVTVLTEDGYKINNIYENYGIISAASNKIPTSEVMKKADEPGVDFFSSSIIGYICA